MTGHDGSERPIRTAHWRIILAAILDLVTIFVVGGFLVASITGGITGSGFKLEGGPAFVLLTLIVAYFWIGRKYLGGTLWQRIFKAY